MHDQKLDIEARNVALDEARGLFVSCTASPMGDWETRRLDKLLADYRYKIYGSSGNGKKRCVRVRMSLARRRARQTPKTLR